jgi:hypothetical protein
MQDEVTVQRFKTAPLTQWKISNIWEEPNKSKFNSGRNYEQTEVKERFLSLCSESFVFQFVIQKFKD